MASRRDFFKTVAGATLATAGCGGGEGSASTQASRAVAAADWTALAHGLRGKLIRPGDGAYQDARRLFIPRFDSVRPSGIAYCANPQDVQECVRFARRSKVPVAVRCGGHGYAGWSTGIGLVIDVSVMDAVRAEGGRAVVGAGARLGDVYTRLATSGVSIPAGSCPSVGVAGSALGGGIGVVARKYGLTCDVLESVQMVTADGRLLVCDAERDRDLYWAARGGGGGNFGVAVEFVFRTHPASEVTLFFYRWPWSRAGAVIGAWQGWLAQLPDELWSNLQLEAGPSLRVGGLYVGDSETCGGLVERLVAMAGEPSSRSLRQTSYEDAMNVMGGCKDYSSAQCHRQGTLPGRTPEGRLAREDFVAKSHLVTRPLPGAAVDVLVNRIGGTPGRAILLDALGGAVGRIAPDATAFPHRSALFSVQYIAGPGDRSWLRGIHGAMNSYAAGTAYVNYADPDLKDWQRAYYGDNYDRLRAVKAAYDPEGLFRFPQSVRR